MKDKSNIKDLLLVVYKLSKQQAHLLTEIETLKDKLDLLELKLRDGSEIRAAYEDKYEDES